MHLVMFDIDDTLVNTSSFEDQCFTKAVKDILNIDIESNWSEYPDVTDSGILQYILSNRANLKVEDSLLLEVQNKFRANISQHIVVHGIEEIPGASKILNELSKREDIALCIATGGWLSTATLKLESVGIDASKLTIASSDDNAQRKVIMEMEERKLDIPSFESKTYFGDADWDRIAAKERGYKFVLVGSKIDHTPQIANFLDRQHVYSLLGLV